MLKNNCLIDSLYFKKIPRTPVWIMRQAGRYLPEYLNTRKKAGSFLNLCKNPDLASEVTIQPIERFDLDAAIIFSDILVVLEAIGFKVDFFEKIGPVIQNPIKNLKDIDLIQSQINDELIFVAEAIKKTKKSLDDRVPLIGFIGSPWTLLTYAVEGGKAQDQFLKSKQLIFNHPKESKKLLEKITLASIEYFNLQILSGADCLMIFDTWGGVLAYDDYEEFSLNYIKKITQFIQTNHPNVPVIVFTKGGGLWLEKIADAKPNGIGLDWTINIAKARKELKNKKIALQGNLDPAVLTGSDQVIKHKAQKIIESYYSVNNSITGHIFNLGHGITPNINPDKLKVLIDYVHQISEQLDK